MLASIVVMVLLSSVGGSERAGVVADDRALAQRGVAQYARPAQRDSRADEAAVELAVAADRDALPEHAVADVGAGLDAHVGDEHGVGSDARSRGDVTARADVKVPVEQRVLGDACTGVHET